LEAAEERGRIPLRQARKPNKAIDQKNKREIFKPDSKVNKKNRFETDIPSSGPTYITLGHKRLASGLHFITPTP